jgi:hypothetical protein
MGRTPASVAGPQPQLLEQTEWGVGSRSAREPQTSWAWYGDGGLYPEAICSRGRVAKHAPPDRVAKHAPSYHTQAPPKDSHLSYMRRGSMHTSKRLPPPQPTRWDSIDTPPWTLSGGTDYTLSPSSTQTDPRTRGRHCMNRPPSSRWTFPTSSTAES